MSNEKDLKEKVKDFMNNVEDKTKEIPLVNKIK